MWRQWIPFWRPGVSPYGGDVDLLFAGLLLASALVLGLLFFLLIVFCVRYRAGNPTDRGHRVKKSWHWEVGWTSASLVIFLLLFVWGASVYLEIYQKPQGELSVFVVAKQWMWKVQHPGGQSEINSLHMPVNRPVHLVMASQDVIHSFFIPALRLKHDVVPGRYQSLEVEAVTAGHYHLFCAEYCGTDHSGMIGEIVAMEPADYAKWLNDQGPANSLAREGGALFRELGCSGCHAANSSVHAPLLEGLYGKPVPLSDGSAVTADDKYIRDSILLPRSQVAAGYQPVMPSFEGKVSEDQLLRLVTYIKSLADRAP
ncbi:cytochrome c oxidase subunit II [Bradyrhizobium sp. BEA-2-5]|uniref:cytochrome c oxidase subunit II n=1 Tax=Bradyrhizobium sp. BEA-2-5 TaxID=3080015 RepID=UPI00293F73F2|nr:cytochrome c oxidase subunit II [Bradyrhizobium sp. BEA-2-5]WOH83300.1 cytochrome c oxidase subunit II [Bradyrhizobium sp. BEA-2-5]